MTEGLGYLGHQVSGTRLGRVGELFAAEDPEDLGRETLEDRSQIYWLRHALTTVCQRRHAARATDSDRIQKQAQNIKERNCVLRRVRSPDPRHVNRCFQ